MLHFGIQSHKHCVSVCVCVTLAVMLSCSELRQKISLTSFVARKLSNTARTQLVDLLSAFLWCLSPTSEHHHSKHVSLIVVQLPPLSLGLSLQH